MPSESLNFFQPGSKNGQGCFCGPNPAWRPQPTIPPGQLKHASSSKGPSPDTGTFKRHSTSSATLLRSGQSGTSVESVSNLEPKLRLLLKSKPLKPLPFDSKDDFRQRIITAVRKGGEGPEHEVFADVSENDYHYILDAIKFDDNIICKPSYIPRLRQLIVNLPTLVHESILAPLRTTMGNIISTLPLPSALSTSLRIHMNTMVEKGEDNEDNEDQRNLGIPDMLIQRKTRDAEFHPLWPFKVSFSQSSEAAEVKIQLTADKNPYIVGGTHFHIAEAERYTLPNNDWAVKQELDRKNIARIREVGGSASGSGIVSFSHTWLHPLQVTVTTWVHPPNGRLNTTNHNARYYATAHLEGEHPLGGSDPLVTLIQPLKQWTIPDTVVNWDTCIDGFEKAAKQTGFRRYRKWHEKFLKRTIDEIDDAEYVPPASSKRGRCD
ncbi:hypothetical protein F4604DRAFT_1916310 [Suillus subluteus]|nr:hypothetical protein F4604DRAFT_1916310 [Suillus subluteus]